MIFAKFGWGGGLSGSEKTLVSDKRDMEKRALRCLIQYGGS